MNRKVLAKKQSGNRPNRFGADTLVLPVYHKPELEPILLAMGSA